ncbi:class III cytochrome C family protein [Nevskia soli]|uniref:class III cytochrome C family protein n=1 Tax=Nevskia soli TaxID=418856 RepID=UPI00056B5262|nr:class III cytochrome C family protein [Nevskia soli]
MKRPVLLVLLAAIAVLAALALVLPEKMLAPGPVAKVHGDLGHDCFACHVPFGGASAERCIACHKPDSIGIATTQGVLLRDRHPVPFHQYLSDRDCLACHGEHEGVRKLSSAHRFSHELLLPEVRQRCESCHSKPNDSLHGTISGGCAQCHSQNGWKPATFEHDRYFPLTGEHQAQCAACHTTNDFRTYTCFGCHEHSPERVRAQHAEEGIRQLDNCVECHRSGRGEGEGRDD